MSRLVRYVEVNNVDLYLMTGWFAENAIEEFKSQLHFIAKL